MRAYLGIVLTMLAAYPAAAADYPNLPAGPGRDVTTRVCSQCHSPEVTATQRLDQAGWKALVDQMAANGAQASDGEFDQITKYLAASFPLKKTVESSGNSNPKAVAQTGPLNKPGLVKQVTGKKIAAATIKARKKAPR